MKVLLGLLGLTLGFEVNNQLGLARKKRSVQECNEYKSMCRTDVEDGIYATAEECMAEMDVMGDCSAAEEEGNCQKYTTDGTNLCCPEGLDADHYWPMIRTNLAAKGPRPLAPNEKCPNGCDIATQIDQFACSYYARVAELKQMFDELEKFFDSDLVEIIKIKEQFVRRYKEVTKGSTRSAEKMVHIKHSITTVVDIVKENEVLIHKLEGEVSEIKISIAEIDAKLEVLHTFCKYGKQCAKQCFFPPSLFGGIKEDCAEYYHSDFWANPDNDHHWQGMPQSGLYIIQPDRHLTPKTVYCDQKTDGGGWTLMHHKGISNSSLWGQYSAPIDDTDRENKYRANWHQPMSGYENGFGWASCNGEADYWMGLEYMSALTYRRSSGGAKLRIDIKDWDHRDYWGYYDKFAIRDSTRSYQMSAGGYSGFGSYSIGDAWAGVAWEGIRKQKMYTKSSGMKFSTKDVDNDKFCLERGKVHNFGYVLPKFNADDVAAKCDLAAQAKAGSWQTDKTYKEWGSCAGQDGAGFWYNRCSAGNINGNVYYNGEDGYYALKELAIENDFGGGSIMRDHDDGMIWGTLNKGRDYSFMLAEMRVRPLNFKPRKSGATKRGGSDLEDERMED